jgi:hypothetical protein
VASWDCITEIQISRTTDFAVAGIGVHIFEAQSGPFDRNNNLRGALRRTCPSHRGRFALCGDLGVLAEVFVQSNVDVIVPVLRSAAGFGEICGVKEKLF